MSATTSQKLLIFGIELCLGEVYRVSDFRTHDPPTSCLTTCTFFIKCAIIKNFRQTATTSQKLLIFGIELCLGEEYRVSDFLTHDHPTSCLTTCTVCHNDDVHGL